MYLYIFLHYLKRRNMFPILPQSPLRPNFGRHRFTRSLASTARTNIRADKWATKNNQNFSLPSPQPDFPLSFMRSECERARVPRRRHAPSSSPPHPTDKSPLRCYSLRLHASSSALRPGFVHGAQDKAHTSKSSRGTSVS
jgi:hypothetical protein